jgi:3-hydroxyisobutyrate dehydrogenase-like beta-hydroxyacid dehydrogenase
MKIGFLGTGLMGTGFVRRPLVQGHTVHACNRSPASFPHRAEVIAGRE